jgi:phospholipid/cholesterol/gamma-HCH transport system substrate-binding protein
MIGEFERNLKLGVFVILSALFLIFGLYMIGNKRNLFGSTYTITAIFKNVNGLVSGNNVRFAGIDIGTVSDITILNDTVVKVTMLVEKKSVGFIKKNSIASIGTDGLMGNKLVNINSVPEPAEIVTEGDLLQSTDLIDTEKMLRTLEITNENIKEITNDFKDISYKINTMNTFWGLLNDTSVSINIKSTISELKYTSENARFLSDDLRNIIKDTRSGKGTIGAMFNDTTLAYNLNQALINIKITSDKAAQATSDLNELINKIEKGEGTLGRLVSDTTFVNNLNETVLSIQEGAKGFNDNMDALKHSFLLRGYFRKKEREK